MDWTSQGFLRSLRAFLFSVTAVCGWSADEECRVKLREVELARELAEEEALTANVALIRTRQTLEDVRARLATAQVEVAELRDELSLVRVQVGSVLVTDERLGQAAVLARFLKETRQAQRAYQQAYDDLLACKRVWEALLDSLAGAEKAVYQQQFDAKLEVALLSLRRAEQYVHIKKEGDGKQDADAGLRVLAVDDELEVVAVNAGRNNGVRIGQVLAIAEGKAQGASLRVIEVQPTLSAAIIESGRFEHIATGAPLIRVVVPD